MSFRSTPVNQAVGESLAALEWLLAQGCQQILSKYCSTFDSTRAGNIGPVADAFADALDAKGVLVCPAFPTTGRAVYQGHLFVGDVLLNEPGMQNHPLTPMTESDIRRWLRHQTESDVSHLVLPTILAGTTAALKAISETLDRFVVADAVTDEDLLTLGAAMQDAPLLTGGSGIALGLPRNFIRTVQATANTPTASLVDGPEAILAGSCSGATRGEIGLHAKAHPTLALGIPGAMEGRVTKQDLLAFFAANTGNAPLIYSSGTPDEVRRVHSEFRREAVADKLDTLFAETARDLIRRGYRRHVVAGGETSGAVAQAVAAELAAPAMRIGAEINPGVPVLSLGTDAPVSLALKSGNFGAPDFHVKALRIMEGSA
ncbi:MAG: 3-oxo-tetronate kinase [Sedimentitalea sp.]|uniref:3-oxo-tetronate kinase n=1 Tax=Sedimentitalea sp. TaxID=2048915 RepID=UPI0032659568